MINFFSSLRTSVKIISGNIFAVVCEVNEEINHFNLLSAFISKNFKNIIYCLNLNNFK
tara:strand:+ start:99 stop:272 length:174 start_codon:yes stop_codon:yes gene_type:complete